MIANVCKGGLCDKGMCACAIFCEGEIIESKVSQPRRFCTGCIVMSAWG